MPPGRPPRIRIGTIEDLNGRLHLAGRVLAVEGRTFILADETGSVKLTTTTGGMPRAGDWIRVITGDGVVQLLELLTPYRGERPFPSPGGEYYRLHGGPEQRAMVLRMRARTLAAIRSFFDEQGFIEIQTPLRVRCPGLEPHLVAEPAGDGECLITSPEYQMKRLLAAGLERIYFLGPCWRGDEVGPHHLGEFCMLEWYQAHSTIEELMEQTEELMAHVSRQVCRTTSIRYKGVDLELEPPYRRITVAQAFAEHAGVDLAGVMEAEQLRRRAEERGLGPFFADARYEEIASRILVERVEPALIGPTPAFLYDFPAPLAALSRLRADNPSVAERFELYAGGLELANAFGELTDPDEQLARLQHDQHARRESGMQVHPIDKRFIDALREGIPPSAGIALGVDRLVMLLCDIEDIRQVVAFAPDEV